MQVLFNSSIFGFKLVLVLVQNLLLQSLLNVTTLLEDLEDVMFNTCILKKKVLNFLNLVSLSQLTQFSLTRNWDVFVGCSETSVSVTVKHVQHIVLIRTFCLPGGTEEIAGLWFAWGDQYPGWHYAFTGQISNYFRILA